MRLNIELWMIIVGISMSLGGFPQVYRMWKRKTSDDISITLWIIMVHGIAWWLYYGIVIGSICLIVTNSVCLILDSVVLAMVVKYRISKGGDTMFSVGKGNTRGIKQTQKGSGKKAKGKSKKSGQGIKGPPKSNQK